MSRRRTLRDQTPCGGIWNDKPCPDLAHFADTLLCRFHDSQRPCEIPGCSGTFFSGGLCKSHYYKPKTGAKKASKQLTETFSVQDVEALRALISEHRSILDKLT